MTVFLCQGIPSVLVTQVKTFLVLDDVKWSLSKLLKNLKVQLEPNKLWIIKVGGKMLGTKKFLKTIKMLRESKSHHLCKG